MRRISEYRDRRGHDRFAVLAHPNYKWAITAEMMAPVADLRFFEVYNSSKGVRNDGDAHRAYTDRIWDIVLALRLGSKKGKLLYGLATDDAHNYHGGGAGPGRGWVMVRSQRLEPEAILDAMDRGDFYATTGVILRDIRCQGNTIRVEIEPQERRQIPYGICRNTPRVRPVEQTHARRQRQRDLQHHAHLQRADRRGVRSQRGY